MMLISTLKVFRANSLLVLVMLLPAACAPQVNAPLGGVDSQADPERQRAPRSTAKSPKIRALVNGAFEQTTYTNRYDPAYVQLDYPGGDVPRERGVCTDVIVRAFRKVGVDLQKEMHEDMKADFSAYPTKWGLTAPDPNIDHRRVDNQMTFFERRGKAVGKSADAADYLPGDVVAWRFENGLLHTGIVSDRVSRFSGNRMIVHNVGAGARVQDVLFRWKIIGHYRWFSMAE